MKGKCVWAGLAVLTLVMGCAEGKLLRKEGEEKAQTKAKAAEKAVLKAVSYDNKKYADKLALAKDGIDFAHSFNCPGAYQNQLKERTEDTHGRLRSYTQVIKCSVSGEVHTSKFFEITYNEKGQKSIYKMDLGCSKTGEQYRLNVKDISYDFSWGVLNYKVEVDGDTLAFPDPEKEKK